MEEQQTPAQRLLGDFAPQIVQLTDDVLFGDIWKRPGLSPRDRSLVTVAILAATYRPDQLNSHLRLALANGLTQDELVETLTHLAFYAGWPSGMAALTQLKTITADTGSGASRQGEHLCHAHVRPGPRQRGARPRSALARQPPSAAATRFGTPATRAYSEGDNEMEYTRLGDTGLKISRLALGCMGYGDPTTEGAHQWALADDEGARRPVSPRH
jgi:4-carboxymuconolactone decarboxylase